MRLNIYLLIIWVYVGFLDLVLAMFVDSFFKKKKKNLLTYLKGRVTEKEKHRQREIFYLLIYSPDGHSSQIWTRQKLASWNSVWTST